MQNYIDKIKHNLPEEELLKPPYLKICSSCENYLEMEEGETDCQKCQDSFAKNIAYYQPIYDGENRGKRPGDDEQSLLDNPKGPKGAK